MRLITCALSAVLLSGCSWLGWGGGSSGSHFQSAHGSYDANCQPQAYGQQYVVPQGCVGGGYNVAQNGYTQGQYGQGQFGQGQYGAAQGYAAQGFSVDQLRGTQGFVQGGNFQGGGFGGQATTLGSSAPFGVNSGAAVQTIQGAPIYVPRPVPGGAACCGPQFVGGGALPFGIESGIGTDFIVGGDIFPGRTVSGPNNFAAADNFDGTFSATRFVSGQPAIAFNDAFDEAIQYDTAATYDLNQNTTVLGRFTYSEANGQTVGLGTAFDTASTGTAIDAASAAPVTAAFSDLEQITLEAGVRQYVGGLNNGLGIRPYVGASAGARYNNSVDVTQSSAAFITAANPTGVDAPIEFIDSGWNPTAAAVVGAEWQATPRFAVGVEAGIRWQDNLDTAFDSEDIWSVPVRLRGRVSF